MAVKNFRALVRYVFAASAMFLAGQAFAAAPAPIPPVPDANRTQTATIVSSTPSLLVNFAVYGDCSDLAVTINTTAAFYPSALWNCDSAGGLPLSTMPLPITDMRVNFTPALTSGTVTISGAWHPRNLTVPTAPSINRREFMQTFSTLVASNRELVQATAALGAPIFAPTLFAAPPPIGSTAPNTGVFTTLSTSNLFTSVVSGDVKAIDITSTGNDTLVFNTTPFSFIASENIGSFGSANTHYGGRFLCSKQVIATGNTTGSRVCFISQQNNAGGTSTDFITVGHFQINAAAGSFNNSGNFTALNADTVIGTGMTPTSAVGVEIDIRTFSNVTNIRQGIRLVDLASTGTWAQSDAAMAIAGTGIGFRQMFQMCDYSGGVPNSNCPYGPGSEVLNAGTSGSVLNSFLNFGGLTATPTLQGVLLPANVAGIGWGTRTACCGGGKVTSNTTSNGGALIFLSLDTIIQTAAGNNSLHVTDNGTESLRFINRTGAPSVGTCGTSPSIAGTNGGGTFTTGTAAPTACTITFATLQSLAGWPTNAWCEITPSNAAASAIAGGFYISAQSKTAFTVTLGTGTSTAAFQYHCDGN